MRRIELGAKWIRQHRRLCLSSLRRNLLLKVNKKVSYLNKKSLSVFEIPVLYMFCSNEHYMSISHMVIFMYMATQQRYESNYSPFSYRQIVGQTGYGNRSRRRKTLTTDMDWSSSLSVCQWPGRPEFNPRLSHTKDSKNGTWCHLA